MNHLGQLSTELISLIIQKVDRHDLYACTLINHAFRAIAIRLLWRTLHDKNIGTFIKLINTPPPSSSSSQNSNNNNNNNNSHRVGQYIRHANFNDLDNTTFILIIHHLPYLETLAIDSARFITDTSLQQLPCHCPHLSSLHLRRTPITRHALVALAHHCPQLTLLDLDKCNNLRMDIFSALSQFPLLQHLCIQGSNFKDIAVREFLAGGMVAADTPDAGAGDDHDPTTTTTTITTEARYLMTLQRLTRLAMTGLPCHLTKSLLVAENGLCWPALTHLCLGSAYTITEWDLLGFLQHHPCLVSLELHMTAFLSDTTLQAMVPLVPTLTHLGLVNWMKVTPQGVRRFVCECTPSLTCVYFGGRYWSDAFSESFPEASGYCFIDLRRRRKLFQLDQASIEAIRLAEADSASLIISSGGGGGGGV